MENIVCLLSADFAHSVLSVNLKFERQPVDVS